MNRIVLEQGKIEILEPRPDYRVATGVPEEVCTSARDRRERRARSSGQSRRSRESKTIRVEVMGATRSRFEIPVHWAASGYDIREIKVFSRRAIHTERIAADGRREGQSAAHRGDAAQLPSGRKPLRNVPPRPLTWNQPDGIDSGNLTHIKVLKTAAHFL